jgi:hypothetical protein
MPIVIEPKHVEELSAEARGIRPGQVALAVLTFILFGVGWLFAQAWFLAVYCALAVREGWREAHAGQVKRAKSRREG